MCSLSYFGPLRCPNSWVHYNELAQYHAAEHVEFEQIFGTPKAIGKVIVEVYGGVAEITSKPENVEVEIIDHDNEEQSALDHVLDSFLERADMPEVAQGEGQSR